MQKQKYFILSCVLLLLSFMMICRVDCSYKDFERFIEENQEMINSEDFVIFRLLGDDIFQKYFADETQIAKEGQKQLETENVSVIRLLAWNYEMIGIYSILPSELYMSIKHLDINLRNIVFLELNDIYKDVLMSKKIVAILFQLMRDGNFSFYHDPKRRSLDSYGRSVFAEAIVEEMIRDRNQVIASSPGKKFLEEFIFSLKKIYFP